MNRTKRNGKTAIPHSRQDDGRPTAFSCSLKPEAVEVYLAGDFNGWNPQADRMPRNGNGAFEKTVALASGEHQYKFVIDGEWYSDPMATRQVPNEFGSVNSVIRV